MAEKKVTEVLTVVMDDGRSVDFPGKTRLLKETLSDSTNILVRLDFRNGETRTFKAPHFLGDVDTAQKKFFIRCAGHGLEQKLGDVTSGIESIEDAIEAVDQLMVRLDKAEWNAQSTGGGSMAGASLLAQALVEVSGNNIAAVRDYLGTVDKKTKDALRVDPEVAPVIKRLEAERDAKAAAKGKTVDKIDTASVLAGLKAGLGAALNPSAVAGPGEAPM